MLLLPEESSHFNLLNIYYTRLLLNSAGIIATNEIRIQSSATLWSIKQMVLIWQAHK